MGAPKHQPGLRGRGGTAALVPAPGVADPLSLGPVQVTPVRRPRPSACVVVQGDDGRPPRTLEQKLIDLFERQAEEAGSRSPPPPIQCRAVP